LGWKKVEYKLLPIQMDRDGTSKELLEVIQCNCKMEGETIRCSCCKKGHECSIGYGKCHDIYLCSMSVVDISEDNE